MKNSWIYRIQGIVYIHIEGEKAVEFINSAVKKNIQIWSIKKVDNDTLGLFARLTDLGKLRVLRRLYGVKLSFHKRQGFPFWFLRMKRNWAFVMGFFSFIFLLTLLSNMVWDVQVTGASKEVEYRILTQLDGIGVKRGAIQFTLMSPQEIQNTLTKNNGDITWVGVERKGTVFHLQVVEKTIPKVAEAKENRDLVAKKAGVVTYILAEAGQAMVKVNQYVKKGQVLISGYIGKEDRLKATAASGKVLAETWYETTVTIPIRNHLDTLTGQVKTSYGLRFFGKEIYLPWMKKPEFEQIYEEVHSTPVYFLKWKLPIHWLEKRFFEGEQVDSVYTKREIQALGEKLAREKMREEIGAESSVYGVKVLRQQATSGKVELTYHFQMIENIGTYKPIENKETLLNDRKTKDH